MCAEHKGEHLSFPCVSQATHPAITSEQTNLFQSIVPPYKSWSPECVWKYTEHNLSFLINLPATHTVQKWNT